MRLLNVHDLEFEEFHHEDVPPYIIASHRWGIDELDFKDLRKRRKTTSSGYRKVLKLCEIIKSSQTEVDWLWIDTVCIDKRSLTEVSETINSMYKWYQNAECCLAYLNDVHSPNAYLEQSDPDAWSEAFCDSTWFKRGWTLQELIAPRAVVFLSADWEVLGHKGQVKLLDPRYFHSGNDLTALISEASGVPEDVLCDREEHRKYGLEEKMSWMDERETTRVEDGAYCLLGLLDIFMLPIYGEGDQAHVRLAKEIVAKETEHQRRVEQEQMQRRMSAIDMDRELAIEEQAMDVAKYVSRKVEDGLSSDQAIRRLGRKWHAKWGVPLEQAVADINYYLEVLTYRSGWAREAMAVLKAQGKTRKTAIRYLEAELRQYGYNTIDACRAVRIRLRYRPIEDNKAKNAALEDLQEEASSEVRMRSRSCAEQLEDSSNQARAGAEVPFNDMVPVALTTDERKAVELDEMQYNPLVAGGVLPSAISLQEENSVTSRADDHMNPAEDELASLSILDVMTFLVKEDTSEIDAEHNAADAFEFDTGGSVGTRQDAASPAVTSLESDETENQQESSIPKQGPSVASKSIECHPFSALTEGQAKTTKCEAIPESPDLFISAENRKGPVQSDHPPGLIYHGVQVPQNASELPGHREESHAKSAETFPESEPAARPEPDALSYDDRQSDLEPRLILERRTPDPEVQPEIDAKWPLAQRSRTAPDEIQPSTRKELITEQKESIGQMAKDYGGGASQTLEEQVRDDVCAII